MGVLGTILSFGAGYALGAKNGMEPVRRVQSKVMRRFPEPIRSIGDRIDVRQVRDVMTAAPQTVTLDASLTTAARVMADNDIGDVIVTESESEKAAGIVTDRDIAIRAVAEGRNPDTTTVEDIFSRDLVAAAPTDTVHDALELMKGLNVRRLPVVEGDRAIGVVSLGDLSIETDVGSTLADISTAAPDH
jgi:CBS domain-containing protein